MEIISEERTYEGIPALPSLVMAVMESSGIREYIDTCCGTERSDCLFLTSGMAVKALVGTMIERGKRPLYCVSDYYSMAPVDKLFGTFVKHESLSDAVIAKRLDTVFNLNTETVLYECYKKLREKYGFSTERLFLDATNYTMFGIKYAESQLEHNAVLIENGIEIKESPMPAYGGNAKDKNNDRVQMNLGCVVDENGIPMFGKSYDGNVSDIRIDEDMIGLLGKFTDMKSIILMADCKLCTNEILGSWISSDIAFVTKVPFNFNSKLKETVLSSVQCSTMTESKTRPKRKYFQTTDEINGTQVRVIAYMLPHAEKDSEKFLKGPGLEKATKKLKSLKSRRFFCEDDALDAFRNTLKELDGECYIADPKVYADEAAEKRHGDGKLYRVESENVRVDESKLRNAVISHAVQVLITNLPFSADHSDNPRKEASADDIIDLYLEQYKVEAGFKMMKSGMNVADVYIHTPSRITAVAFIVCLATTVCKTMDFVLRKKKEPGKRRITVKSLADIHANTIVNTIVRTTDCQLWDFQVRHTRFLR